MDTVPEWGFQSFYVASAVCFISSAIFVKVSISAAIFMLSSPSLDRPIKLFPQHGFQKKSFITNIPFLISFFIGILSALFWLFLILNLDDAIPTLGSYCWLPFANVSGEGQRQL